jgi:hypothetical protein
VHEKHVILPTIGPKLSIASGISEIKLFCQKKRTKTIYKKLKNFGFLGTDHFWDGLPEESADLQLENTQGNQIFPFELAPLEIKGPTYPVTFPAFFPHSVPAD